MFFFFRKPVGWKFGSLEGSLQNFLRIFHVSNYQELGLYKYIHLRQYFNVWQAKVS